MEAFKLEVVRKVTKTEKQLKTKVSKKVICHSHPPSLIVMQAFKVTVMSTVNCIREGSGMFMTNQFPAALIFL